MIRLLVRFGAWLDARFPEKLVVTASDYAGLQQRLAAADAEINLLRSDLAELKQNHAATLDRLGRVESAAVHKEAVKDLVGVVQGLKDEIVALKANLGWSKPNVASAELQAMLNGEVLNAE